MSVGKALENFTDFVGRILGSYEDINVLGQAYRGLGSLVPKTPDFPLPESVEKYLKEDVPVRDIPPVTQGTSPQLGPSRQGAVLSQGGFFRTPTQKTSKSMQAGRYSEGGSVDPEYLYGLGPEASGIGQFLSPLLPFRREVIEPYQEIFSDAYVGSDGKLYVDRSITPGEYGEPEFAVPEAVQAFLNFKGLARDPEARQAVMEGLASLPGLPEEISRRLQLSTQAAMSGQDEVYDPVSGGTVTASEALLMTPLLNAPGTAASLFQAGDQAGTVFGMMGGKNASGSVGKAAKEAEKMFDEGRRETAVYRKTGAIRVTENKPGVFIDAVGEGGLDTSKFEELLEGPGGVHGSMTTLDFTDYVDFPNGVEAYPELKDFKIEFLDDSSPFWKKTTAPIKFMSSFKSGDKTIVPPTFYVRTRFNVRDNTHQPSDLSTNVKSKFALAIQDYISEKEGFVRTTALNPLEQESQRSKDAKTAAFEFRLGIERPQGYAGPRQALSPMDEYRAAQLKYPATIEAATTSELARLRQAAMQYDDRFEDADKYRRGVTEAYGIQKLDKYPTYFGGLMGDMNFPTKFTIEYQSPLFDIVENLPQEKGTGNQFLAAIKKAGVKQEDLLYSGLEVFLTNNKSVTKSEIRDRLYEREVPVYEKFLEDDEGKNIFYPTSYITGDRHDNLELAPEAQASDPRSLALVTQTDPLTGINATGASVGLHNKLPENTFAHMRFNTRTVRVNGEPVEVLFIDEIQSDWHQRGKTMVSELIETEAPDAQGKKSGKIVGGEALKELLFEKIEQVPDIQYDSTIPNKIADEAVKKTEEITAGLKFDTNSATRRIYEQEYLKAGKKILGISDAEIKAYAKKKVYGKELPDAAFKDNWHELSFRRLVREAVEEDLDGVAFTPDFLQNLRYGKQYSDPKDQFDFYDKVLAPYVQKYAKRNGTKLERAGLRFADDEAMKAAGFESDVSVYYMPLSDEIKQTYREPIPTYAMGGGVGSLAPIARNMYKIPSVKRGVGSYISQMRR